MSWTYSDADDDPEQSSIVEWIKDGSVVASGVNTWTAKTLGKTMTLQARVTPFSVPSANPYKGMAATSEAVIVVAEIAKFVMPLTNARNWNDADTYCKGLKARLPTRLELQELYLDSASATSLGDISDEARPHNYEMCDSHGWPLGGSRCGGVNNVYWTNERGSLGDYYYVEMDSGAIIVGYFMRTNQVACIKE